MPKATEADVKAFKPGIYVHYKGPRYHALFLGEDSTNREQLTVEVPHAKWKTESTQEPMVAYVPLEGEFAGKVKFRELWQWNEMVTIDLHMKTDAPVRVRRFTHIDDWKVNR